MVTSLNPEILSLSCLSESFGKLKQKQLNIQAAPD